jgi:hypothetical protein
MVDAAFVSSSEWRTAVTDVAQDLARTPEGSCPFLSVATHVGERAVAAPSVDIEKAEFYASASVAIHAHAELTLVGSAYETRFKDINPIDFYRPEVDTIESYLEATTLMGMTIGGSTPHRLHTFKQAALQHQYRPGIDAGMLETGCLPKEIAAFGKLTVPLIQEHPLTKSLDGQSRIRIAHELSSVLVGRAAVNIGSVFKRPRLDTHTGVGIRIVGGLHQLVDSNGKPLSPGHGVGPAIGPTLKCPAHVAVDDSPESETSLKRFIAAGVNLIGDVGLYGPVV